MNESVPAYGLWGLVIINSAIFILFAFSFIKPKTRLDWRSLGAFSAFIVAMFVEMYGFPLTIYLLSGWLQSRFPQTDIFSHESGHLWHTLFGWETDPHANPLHLVSNLMILAGFIIIYKAWKVLHQAQQADTLARTGPYEYVRHPQYGGLIIIITGFLIMWPTLLTLIMYPVLIVVYIRLAKKEEKMIRREFGEAYDDYAREVPAFLPKMTGNSFHKTRSNER